MCYDFIYWANDPYYFSALYGTVQEWTIEDSCLEVW